MKIGKGLIIFSIVGAILCGAVLLLDPFELFIYEKNEGLHIGIVAEVENDVRIKHKGNFSWLKLRAKDKIYTHSKVFTDKNGKARFILADKTEIIQTPLTMVDMQFKVKKIEELDKNGPHGKSISIGVESGTIEIRTLDNHKVDNIQVGAKHVSLGKNQETSAEIKKDKDEMVVRVGAGEVELDIDGKIRKITKGQKIEGNSSKPSNEVRVTKDDKDYQFPEMEFGDDAQTRPYSSMEQSDNGEDKDVSDELYHSYKEAFLKERQFKEFLRKLADILKVN